jgi:hypothetical protein
MRERRFQQGKFISYEPVSAGCAAGHDELVWETFAQ